MNPCLEISIMIDASPSKCGGILETGAELMT